MMMRKYISDFVRFKFDVGCFSLLLILTCALAQAQTASQQIRDGNKLYVEGKYDEAEIKYRKSLEKKPRNTIGQYNLANALYRQQKFGEASAILDSLAAKMPSKTQKAQMYHNLGNNFLKNKDYENSINAYKNALKYNPEDEDTRYNLSYAMEKLKQQQQQQQQQQDKEKQKEKQEKQENKDDQSKKDEKQEQQEQQQEQQKDKLTREDAERMLDGLNQEENELHKEKAKQKKVGVIKIEKDW